MSVGAKRCVQCGILKEDTGFRKYTYSKQNNTEGTYRVCKDCEAINSQYRRAKAVLDRHVTTVERIKAETTVLEIEELYDLLEKNGLRTPRTTAVRPALDENKKIAQIKLMYSVDTQTKTAPPIPSAPSLLRSDLPEELEKWLNADPEIWVVADASPEYLQETIYESLKAKYRPRIGTDKDTFLPIFDDTYKDVLNAILRKFDDYEEAYANKEGDIQ